MSWNRSGRETAKDESGRKTAKDESGRETAKDESGRKTAKEQSGRKTATSTKMMNDGMSGRRHAVTRCDPHAVTCVELLTAGP